MGKIDILNLEWPQSDRDLHIVTPVLLYLQKRYHLRFKTESIFNGYYYLLKYRPKMLVISNFAGDKINHEVVKTAYEMGIKVVSLISEGNVKSEYVHQFLWGWNKEKRLYVDKLCLWSERSRRLFTEAYPEYANFFTVTGATGFDRYRLLTFKTKEAFLRENSLSFRKIVGIAGWGFDHLFGAYYQQHEAQYLQVMGQKQIKMHRDDLVKLRRIYRELIEQNRDTLFILRYHPGTIDFEKSEFFGLEKYGNVFVSIPHQNTRYTISDLINISDLWIGYETTTALEAWLMGKQTFLINPSGKDFIRENVHRGSPIVQTTQEAQKFLDAFFTNKRIEAFERLQQYREEVIRDAIGYADGQNHIRAAEAIYAIFETPSNRAWKSGARIYRKMGKQILKLLLAKTIFRKQWSHMRQHSGFAQSYQIEYDRVIHV